MLCYLGKETNCKHLCYRDGTQNTSSGVKETHTNKGKIIELALWHMAQAGLRVAQGTQEPLRCDVQKYRFLSVIDSSFKFDVRLSGMSFEAVFSFGPNSGQKAVTGMIWFESMKRSVLSLQEEHGSALEPRISSHGRCITPPVFVSVQKQGGEKDQLVLIAGSGLVRVGLDPELSAADSLHLLT